MSILKRNISFWGGVQIKEIHPKPITAITTMGMRRQNAAGRGIATHPATSTVAAIHMYKYAIYFTSTCWAQRPNLPTTSIYSWQSIWAHRITKGGRDLYDPAPILPNTQPEPTLVQLKTAFASWICAKHRATLTHNLMTSVSTACDEMEDDSSSSRATLWSRQEQTLFQQSA